MVEELKLEQFYANRGIDLITPETGMQIMARVLGQGTAHLVAISANWATARETSPMAAMPPLFSQLDVAEDDRIVAAGDADGISLVAALSDTPPHERSDMVTSHLQELAARVLQLDGTRFTEHDPLTSLGMDSMMAIEVKQRIEAALHVGVSVLELLQGVTIAELATRILESLTLPETAPDTGVAGPAGPEAELETLSMDEIDRLLADVTTADLEELLNELERDTN